MHKPSKCPTHLLHDSPIGEDLFTHGTDGPHQRTADAIAELILSEESKGQAIGLEGGWGSGKSNIIEILKKVFSVGRKDGENTEQSSDVQLFVFDAWAHEGDPLRKSFLLALIEHLQTHKWLPDDKNWAYEKSEIANKRVTSESTTDSAPSPFGILFGISLLFLPFGAALTSAGARLGVFPLSLALEPNWTLIMGMSLTAIPLLLVLGVVVGVALGWIDKS